MRGKGWGANVVIVPVWKGGEPVLFALIDAEDAIRVASQTWHLSPGGYAVTWRGSMHRFVLGLSKGDRIVHHINEQKMDNRKANLEICADMSAANARPHPKRDEAIRRAMDTRALRRRYA